MSTSAGTKEFRPVLDELEAQGWLVEQTRNGHVKAVPPDRSKEMVHFSMSVDARAMRNAIADLKKQGFEWPPPDRRPKLHLVSPQEEKPVHQPTLPARLPIPSETDSPSANLDLSNEVRLNQLFTELKEARSYLALAETDLRDKRAAVQAATQAAEAAVVELDAAQQRMADAKRKFAEEVERRA